MKEISSNEQVHEDLAGLIYFFIGTFIYFFAQFLQTSIGVTFSLKVQLIMTCFPVFSLMLMVSRKFDSYKSLLKNPKGLKIFLGLFASMMGDAFLAYQNKDARYFQAGLVCFLIAHMLYVLAFDWNAFRLDLFLLFSSITGSIYFVVFELWNTSAIDPILKVACAVYCFVIGLMAWRAWANVNLKESSKYSKRNLYAGIGSLLFIISDSILATNKFSFPVFGSQYSIMAAYYLAQYYITKSVPNLKEDFDKKEN